MGLVMDWYEWPSIEAFEIWHAQKIAELHLPKTSLNQQSGEPDPKTQKTEDYTAPYQISGVVIAEVEHEYADGLRSTTLRPSIVDPTETGK